MKSVRVLQKFCFRLSFLLLIFIDLAGANTPKDCKTGQKFRYWGDSEGEQGEPQAAGTTVVYMDTGAGKNNVPPEGGGDGGTINCCGKVVQWEGDYRSGVKTENTYHIFRPEGGTTFLNLGGGSISGDVGLYAAKPTGAFLYIQPGDKMAFTGNNIEWRATTKYDSLLLGHVLAEKFPNVPIPKERYNMATEHPKTTDNTQNKPHMFALAYDLQVDPRPDPECTIYLPLDVLTEATPIGTSVGVISTSKQVDNTIPGYNYTLNAGGLSLKVDPITGEITTTADLRVKTPPTSDTYTLTGETVEMICFKKGTCTAKLKLDFVNYPILVTANPSDYTLLESTTVQTEIAVFDTTDANRPRVDNIPDCVIAGSSPFGAPFELTRHTIQTKFKLKYTAAVQIDYDLVKIYRLTVMCKDKYFSTASIIYNVTIAPNIAPSVANPVDPLTKKICVQVDVRRVKKDDVVLQLLVSDKENDKINTSIEYQGNSATYFDYNNGKAKYAITAKEDLRPIEEKNFNFLVQFWDIWNRPTRYRCCLNIVGINTRPEFSNCPQNIQLSEDKPAAYEVFDIGIIDSNAKRDSQSSDFSVVTVTPTQFSDTFVLNKVNGKLTVSNTGYGIDYEKSATLLDGKCIRVEISVTDGIHPALRNCELCVFILDVNEPPLFQTKTFNVNFNEELSVPYLLPVSLSVNDPDIIDTNRVTYEILSSSNSGGYFDIDEKTGDIRLRLKCDLEDTCPSTFKLAIQAKDGRGMTDLATVNVNVNNINDNAPVFTQPKYEIALNLDTTTSEVLAKVTANDADPSINGVFTYDMSGFGYGKQYFTCSSTGEVRLKEKLPFTETTKFTISVEGRDQGSPVQIGYTEIEITYTVDPSKLTTPAVKRDDPCLSCTPSGVVIITSFVLLGCVIVAFIGYQLYRFSGGDCMDRLSGDKKVMSRDGMYDSYDDGVSYSRVQRFNNKPLPPSGAYEN